MRSGSRPTPEGSRLLFAGDTVSPMMCPADRQPKDDKKGHTEDKPRLGQRQSRKKQDYTATRGWLLVECGSAWCLEVIRCVWYDWYIAIYRNIMPRITRYHKIRYIGISYPYPEFLGLIWRYRIPSKYFSIPNSIVCQLGAPSLVHQESKRNGYLAVERQKQWYLLESVPYQN